MYNSFITSRYLRVLRLRTRIFETGSKGTVRTMSISPKEKEPQIEKDTKRAPKKFYTEVAYILGLFILVVGTALMERADFGVSMVVAPAYVLHLKLSQTLPFFTFGMAEYTLQAVLIVIIALLMRKIRFSYLFSFVTAVIYGLMLDVVMTVVAFFPPPDFAGRIVFFAVGLLCSAAGVSMLFHTYISPEAYELFVKELSAKYSVNINKFKTCYDIVSCIVSILLSFLFFGLWHFEGVKLGTVITALVNGFIISRFSKFYESHWEFTDALPFRSKF